MLRTRGGSDTPQRDLKNRRSSLSLSSRGSAEHRHVLRKLALADVNRIAFAEAARADRTEKACQREKEEGREGRDCKRRVDMGHDFGGRAKVHDERRAR